MCRRWSGFTTANKNQLSICILYFISHYIFPSLDSYRFTNSLRLPFCEAFGSVCCVRTCHYRSNIGDDANDVFCKLVPFWQLELYFGKVLGRTPLQQSDKGGFYPDVYEYARNKDYTFWQCVLRANLPLPTPYFYIVQTNCPICTPRLHRVWNIPSHLLYALTHLPYPALR